MSIELQLAIHFLMIITTVCAFEYCLKQEQRKLNILQDRVKLMEGIIQYYKSEDVD